MQRRRLLGALAVSAFLFAPFGARPGDRTWQSTLSRDHPLVGRIWDAGRGRFVSSAALIESLNGAAFALLGEVHDNPDHHAIQVEVLEALARTGARRGIVFEQFDREFEPALRRLFAGGEPGVEDVANTVNFDRGGWNWDFYRPLVAIALRYGMPIATGNLSRKAASPIAKHGMSALDPARVAALRLESAWSAEREEAMRAIVADGHCGALPVSALPRMAAAQRVRDATLAQAMLEVAPAGAVLIAGNGHVRRDLGAPLYLAAAAPDRSCCAVGIIEVQAGRGDPAAYLSAAAVNVRPFDYVWFTPRRERPDPCLAFQRPPADK